jgi:hypothetical protein
MTDPGSSMSLAAVLVLTVVVLVRLGGWLGAVFYAGREPRGDGRRGGGHLGGADQPQASPAEPTAGSADQTG